MNELELFHFTIFPKRVTALHHVCGDELEGVVDTLARVESLVNWFVGLLEEGVEGHLFEQVLFFELELFLYGLGCQAFESCLGDLLDEVGQACKQMLNIWVDHFLVLC